MRTTLKFYDDDEAKTEFEICIIHIHTAVAAVAGVGEMGVAETALHGSLIAAAKLKAVRRMRSIFMCFMRKQ